MKLSLIAVLSLGLTAPTLWSQETWEKGEVAKLFAELHPKEEAWQEIPWFASLVPAQRQAAEARKPMFVWAMDGHPMGCT